MQLNTALDDHEPESGARPMAHVASAMERIEQPRLVRFRNPNSAVPHATNSIRAVAFNRKIHAASRLGVFHGIGEQIREYMVKQALIAFGGCAGGEIMEINRASLSGGGEDLIANFHSQCTKE